MLTAKFVRAHAVPAGYKTFHWFMKLIYEFWGFSVNGGDDLKSPGGFAPISGVYVMPWFANDTGLLASGSDGYTADGMSFFNSASPTAFSASYVNKWIVTWKSGSASTDDSIYQITQWLNSSSLRVNTLHGGTPYSGTLRPAFEARNNINYRVVDFGPAALMSVNNNTSSLVLQFNGASEVNPGQSNSQVRLRMAVAPPPYLTWYAWGIAFGMSPSGSWFHSGSASFGGESIPEVVAGSGNSTYMFDNSLSSDSPSYITMMGAQDFLMCHVKRSGGPEGTGFHIEVPQRLYPRGVDPNPLMVMPFGLYAPTSTDAGYHYAGGCFMHNPPDNTLYTYVGMARRFVGTSETATLGTATNGRLNGAYFNTYLNKFLFSDVVLALGSTTGQYQMARTRLRRVRIIPEIIPSWQRVGNNGEWIHIRDGVLWPWDNTLLPYNLFVGGV